jgi:hypothetical protein
MGWLEPCLPILGWTGTNTLAYNAYYDLKLIAALKSFMVQVPEVTFSYRQTYKTFSASSQK